MFGNRKTQRGPNARQDLSVTLEELYNGAKKDYTISRNVLFIIKINHNSHSMYYLEWINKINVIKAEFSTFLI